MDNHRPATEILERQRHGTLYSTPDTRHIRWTKSGITFLERDKLIALLNCPNGTPPVGSDEWEVVRHAWIEHQVLPDGAYWPKALARNAWSKQFILEEK